MPMRKKGPENAGWAADHQNWYYQIEEQFLPVIDRRVGPIHNSALKKAASELV
jgi:hypothetical protein